jgi:hypothetical protein
MAQTPPAISSSLLPPASAEYQTAMHAPAGKMPQVRNWKMFRSTKGETHLDFGKTGLITKPGAAGSILLDHEKREARIVPPPAPAQPPPGSPKAPAGAPHLPPLPAAPQVKDLGKRIIGGHEAEGKLYTFRPPKAPGLPQPAVKLPGIPAKPPVPGVVPAAPPMPALGKPPAPGAPPAKVQTLEVWTHAQLKVPLLTKANGIPGLQSSVCKSAKAGEPPASRFQIPPGYKLVQPKPPALPKPPAPPKLPG